MRTQEEREQFNRDCRAAMERWAFDSQVLLKCPLGGECVPPDCNAISYIKWLENDSKAGDK